MQMTANNQRVYFRSSDRERIQFRATPAASASIGAITGTAIRFNELSSDRGGYRVRLLPGSARFADRVFMLFNHDWGNVIGNSANGTLSYSTGNTAVSFSCDLPSTNLGRDMLALVRAGYIDGVSFAMVEKPVGREITENGQAIFEISSFLVDEFSIVAQPSFERASASVSAAPVREQHARRLDDLRSRWIRREHQEALDRINSYKLPEPI